MSEHSLAIAFTMLIEPNASPSLGQDHLKRGLAVF
jgi:hypothetical protein